MSCPLAKVQGMYLDKHLTGRMERRLPIVVVVCLDGLDGEGEKQEKAYTDNLSPHGVRVVSKRPWRPGQQAEITPMSEKSPMCGEVVYCQKLDDARFCVDLKFSQDQIPWLILQRFDGT